MPEPTDCNIVFHNEDGNPARANFKQALGYLKDGDGDGNSYAQDGDPSQDDVRLCLDDDLKKAQDHSQRQAPKVFFMTLPQDCTYGKVACIAHKLKRKVPSGQSRLELRLNTFIGEDERSILLKKMSHRSGNFGKILNEPSVETGMTEKTPNTLDGGGMRPDWRLHRFKHLVYTREAISE
ncbi:hypothetical protein Tco_0706004 [Tanacetum coccineum]|uniref:Uncharacterized protein n=1 Tax=Tanacetum coccineum TaxID=301880 RepID=A0ABQ4Y7Q5_9ASTR